MHRSIIGSALVAALAASACGDSTPESSVLVGGSPAVAPAADSDAGVTERDAAPIDPRVVDYGEALRTATLKLVGDLPTLAEVQGLVTAPDMRAYYEARIDALLADPRFARTQIEWWKGTFKTGASTAPADGAPDFDAAATFAAFVTVTGRPYTELFTATAGTCPTFERGAFVPHDCPGGRASVGVLSDPGLMAQYYGNLAFRRVRFVQETFACSAFPAEFAAQPKVIDTGVYTSPWPFESIAGHVTSASPSVDFQATSGRVCANCHSTMNHVAPLFAYFDRTGRPSSDIAVPRPGTDAVKLTDWLPAGEPFAWRSGVPAHDLDELGRQLAKDPDVARCAVARVWSFAWSRGDIVDDQASVSGDAVAALTADFQQSGYDLRRVLRRVLTADDFVRF